MHTRLQPHAYAPATACTHANNHMGTTAAYAPMSASLWPYLCPRACDPYVHAPATVEARNGPTEFALGTHRHARDGAPYLRRAPTPLSLSVPGRSFWPTTGPCTAALAGGTAGLDTYGVSTRVQCAQRLT